MRQTTRESAGIPRSSGILPQPVSSLSRFERMAEAESDTRQYIGLDRNERISPFPDWFMEEIRAQVDSTVLNWYPHQDKLHRQIRESLDLPEERLILTPSSDAAFKSIYQAYIRPGDQVVMLDPSYAMFPVYSDMFEGESVLIPYNKSLELDTEYLLRSIVPGVRLLMIANPNQPTGTLLDDGLLLEVIERASDVGALVTMDEAYYDFCGSTAIRWVESYPNLLVTRTFSKGAGLAGLRLGYVAGHPEVINNLYKVRTVNDLNSFAVLCASLVMEHPEVVTDYVAEVEAGSKVIMEKVGAMGLEVVPSHTNFTLIRLGNKYDPGEIVDGLKKRGYLVKGPLGSDCVSDCIRIALGPPKMMVDFSKSLEETLSSDF